jgi:hypothetical protein
MAVEARRPRASRVIGRRRAPGSTRAMARSPVTAEARAAQAALADDGLCNLDSPPVLSVIDDLRTIEVGEDQVVTRFR